MAGISPDRIGLASRTLRDGNRDKSSLMRPDGELQSAWLPHAATQRTGAIWRLTAQLSTRLAAIS
ncbi:hypothetical protein CUV01_10225 [Paracoccus tegillarcae]|uniref:Uncharacterized protein n=1 Tax=Paracoccus tegillarcae TaxID=1529068 RepID=A0A2K9EPY8_9RHOB|nr:hypothetical protein CUV01_10225 [Paracoccus tegillarcae]